MCCLKATQMFVVRRLTQMCCLKVTQMVVANADVLFEGYADVRCLKAYSGALRVTDQIPPTEVGGLVQVLSIRLPTRT